MKKTSNHHKMSPATCSQSGIPPTQVSGVNWFSFSSESIVNPIKMTCADQAFYSLSKHEQEKTKKLQKIAQEFKSILENGED